MTNSSDDHKTQARETAALRLKEAEEMARSVSELCQKAALIPHKTNDSTFLPNQTVSSTKRLRSRQLKKEKP